MANGDWWCRARPDLQLDNSGQSASSCHIASSSFRLLLLVHCKFPCESGTNFFFFFFFCKFGSGRIRKWRGSGRVGNDSWVMAIEYHERALACHAVDSVVMGEFCKREPVAPVGLLVVDEDTEILLNFLINLFCLAIRLWVEGCGCIGCDVEHPV